MITVSSLTKQYGRRTAVDDMTFDVAAGRVTGFVGPNGAGKSTTMRMMVGLTRPDHGNVRYHGVSYTQLLRPARVVGAVLDARSMHPGRTARNHLRAAAAASGIRQTRVDEVLNEVGLDTAADQRAGTFSLGMRQRLALAQPPCLDRQIERSVTHDALRFDLGEPWRFHAQRRASTPGPTAGIADRCRAGLVADDELRARTRGSLDLQQHFWVTEADRTCGEVPLAR